MSKTLPFFITASAAAAPQKREPWFSIKAEAGKAELKLRGYIGQASKGYDYWTGEEYETGGAGTLQEFEAALTALGKVDLIDLYITSEGGDFPTAIAISSILARQEARIVCTIDGFAYSAAPVIACAADEIRAASNALLMIHDAEFWCAGADVETLRKHIETLDACNKSMAAAFINKAGGTEAEWMTRMTATTWLTGAQAKEIGLVDTLLDEVALSAYKPLKGITAARNAPAEITALIDKSSPASSPTPTAPASIMKPTPELIAAALAFGITLTAASTEADVAAALTKITAAAKPAEVPPVVTPEVTATAPLTLDGIQSTVTAALKPLQDRLEKIEGAQKHTAEVTAHGIPAVTAAAPAPIAGSPKAGEEKATSNLGSVSAAWTPAKRNTAAA